MFYFSKHPDVLGVGCLDSPPKRANTERYVICLSHVIRESEPSETRVFNKNGGIEMLNVPHVFTLTHINIILPSVAISFVFSP